MVSDWSQEMKAAAIADAVKVCEQAEHIVKLENALRRIYSTIADPEGLSESDQIDKILDHAGEALGIPQLLEDAARGRSAQPAT